MEKKVKSTTKKPTKKVIKKQVTKKQTKSNSKKKKGFTLIELLAVIIILGILMIIAIPSVTRYINDSRKSAYIDTAKEVISGTRNLVNEGKLGMYDTNATYYIPAKYVNTENSLKSPYGEFTDNSAYVGVIYDGKGYKYYWISSDDAGQGIPDITLSDKLDTDNIKSDLNPEDIRSTIETTGIGNRTTIMILKMDGTWEEQIILSNTDNNVSEEGSSGSNLENNVVKYPEGKTKDTVEIGDIVTIDTEEFYVVKHDGADLILLAHYNLKVGSIYDGGVFKREYTSSDEGYGKQSSETKGLISSSTYANGTTIFSLSNYWEGKVGYDYPGNYCNRRYYTNCANVYDNNSTVYQYVEAYKTYLKGKGAPVKEARLMTLEEAYEFNGLDEAAFKETTYWLGTPSSISEMWVITTNGSFMTYSYLLAYFVGVRPVIVI